MAAFNCSAMRLAPAARSSQNIVERSLTRAPPSNSRRDDSCHPGGHSDTLTFNIYGYVPSLAAGIVFLIAFSVLTAVHLGVVVRSRLWWTCVIVIGGLCEILGWVGRLWSHINVSRVASECEPCCGEADQPRHARTLRPLQVYNINGFLLQEILLILAPCFFSAAVYGITGMLISAIGPEFSVLRSVPPLAPAVAGRDPQCARLTSRSSFFAGQSGT